MKHELHGLQNIIWEFDGNEYSTGHRRNEWPSSDNCLPLAHSHWLLGS